MELASKLVPMQTFRPFLILDVGKQNHQSSQWKGQKSRTGHSRVLRELVKNTVTVITLLGFPSKEGPSYSFHLHCQVRMKVENRTQNMFNIK